MHKQTDRKITRREWEKKREGQFKWFQLEAFVYNRITFGDGLYVQTISITSTLSVATCLVPWKKREREMYNLGLQPFLRGCLVDLGRFFVLFFKPPTTWNYYKFRQGRTRRNNINQWAPREQKEYGSSLNPKVLTNNNVSLWRKEEEKHAPPQSNWISRDETEKKREGNTSFFCYGNINGLQRSGTFVWMKRKKNYLKSNQIRHQTRDVITL